MMIREKTFLYQQEDVAVGVLNNELPALKVEDWVAVFITLVAIGVVLGVAILTGLHHGWVWGVLAGLGLCGTLSSIIAVCACVAGARSGNG